MYSLDYDTPSLHPVLLMTAASLGAGTERSVTLPTEAVQSTKNSSDLLRRFKEMGANMKSHGDLPEDETALRVHATQSLPC